jgi:hypothetical protein
MAMVLTVSTDLDFIHCRACKYMKKIRRYTNTPLDAERSYEMLSATMLPQWPFYKMKSGRSKRNYLKNPTNIPDIPHAG